MRSIIYYVVVRFVSLLPIFFSSFFSFAVAVDSVCCSPAPFLMAGIKSRQVHPLRSHFFAASISLSRADMISLSVAFSISNDALPLILNWQNVMALTRDELYNLISPLRGY